MNLNELPIELNSRGTACSGDVLFEIILLRSPPLLCPLPLSVSQGLNCTCQYSKSKEFPVHGDWFLTLRTNICIKILKTQGPFSSSFTRISSVSHSISLVNVRRWIQVSKSSTRCQWKAGKKGQGGHLNTRDHPPPDQRYNLLPCTCYYVLYLSHVVTVEQVSFT